MLLAPLLALASEELVSLRMNNVLVTGDDVYMACSVELPREAAHIGSCLRTAWQALSSRARSSASSQVHAGG
jgi:hypothetical protein